MAVPVYQTSPVSLSINGWFGYESIIAPDTSLPCTRTVTLRSALDNLSQDTIKVCGSLPATRLSVELAWLVLCGIRREEKEKTAIQAIIQTSYRAYRAIYSALHSREGRGSKERSFYRL